MEENRTNEKTGAAYRASLPPNRLAVAFDFDGTLTRTDTTKIILFLLLASRPYKAFIAASLILQFATGKLSAQEFKSVAISKMLMGAKEELVERAASRYSRSVRPLTRPSIVERLKTHFERGDLVILASASPAFAIRNVFSEYKVSIIATDFELKDGIYTGECSGNCYGERKSLRIKQLLEHNGHPRLDYAYGDDIADAPMLRMADAAFIVQGDGRAVAWKVWDYTVKGSQQELSQE